MVPLTWEGLDKCSKKIMKGFSGHIKELELHPVHKGDPLAVFKRKSEMTHQCGIYLTHIISSNRGIKLFPPDNFKSAQET